MRLAGVRILIQVSNCGIRDLKIRLDISGDVSR